MQEKLVELKDIQLKYGDNHVLKDINLSLSKGQILTVIGPNGAGKTSLLKVILKLINPISGQVISNSGLTIGYVPQKITIDKTLPLTVKRFLSVNNKNRADNIINVLKEVKVEHLLNSMLHNISGGELQRVLLARALLNNPQLLVLDEPVQGVDLSGQQELYGLIADIKDKHNCSVLLVSHDLTLVMAKTDEVLCLHKHICCHGKPEVVSTHKDVVALFGEKAKDIGLYVHKHNHKHDLHGDIVGKE